MSLNWDLIWNTLFDVVESSTQLDRRNVGFDTGRQSQRGGRSSGRYCEIKWDLVPINGAGGDWSQDGEDYVVVAERQLVIQYEFGSGRHDPRGLLAQAEADRLVVASSHPEIVALLKPVGISVLSWSPVIDNPDRTTDQHLQSTATVVGTYDFRYCTTADDLGIAVEDPGYFDRVEFCKVGEDPYRIAVAPAAVPEAIDTAAVWQHLWLGGGTDLVRGWRLAGTALFNVEDTMVLDDGLSVAMCDNLDLGQLLDGQSMAVVCTVASSVGALIGRDSGAVGWRVQTNADQSITAYVSDGTTSDSVTVAGVATGTQQVFTLGGIGTDLQLVGPSGSDTALLDIRRDDPSPLTVGLFGVPSALGAVSLIGFADMDPVALRDAVVAALVP